MSLSREATDPGSPEDAACPISSLIRAAITLREAVVQALDGTPMAEVLARNHKAILLAPSILDEGTERQTKVLFLSFRAGLDETGPGKMLDFSRATLADRWQAGALEMRAALRTLGMVHEHRTEPVIGYVRA